MKISKRELKRIIREELKKAVGVNEEDVNEEDVNEEDETVEEETDPTERLAQLEEEIKTLKARLKEGN